MEGRHPPALLPYSLIRRRVEPAGSFLRRSGPQAAKADRSFFLRDSGMEGKTGLDGFGNV